MAHLRSSRLYFTTDFGLFNGQDLIILTDFETGLLPAIQQIIPNTRNQGCWFHYCQALWRRVQTLGLTIEYKRNLDVPSIEEWIGNVGPFRLTVNNEPNRTNNAVESFHAGLIRQL
uniref:MULE transposase domain-containing protein n=1 Tax=Strigamia maritima TaxID=126957 RepID=T1J9D5_STRMM